MAWIKSIYLDIVEGRSRNELVFLAVGLVIQMLTYILTQSTFLSLVSGLSGVLSVVLCSQKKMSYYVFGYIQLLTYVVLCIEQKLYGEIVENVFYFVTMLAGMSIWLKHYDEVDKEVKVRKLDGYLETVVMIGTIIGTYMLSNCLDKTGDTQPIMDAITTVPAFVAHILLMLRYKDSWLYWCIVDVGSIIMWWNAGNYCMVVQYVFWTVNCLYGWHKWSEISEI